MAKNPFVIRAQVNGGNSAGFAQTEIDLGSYTNLGSSKPEVLRIHKTHVYLTNPTGFFPKMDADKADSAAWQLTTQSQTGLVLPDDDSFIAGGVGAYRNPDSAEEEPSQATEQGIQAQDYENGYVVAVPSLFLGAIGGADFVQDCVFTVVLECTTEPMSKANAVSLAISQQ
tara:strand:+ start:53 stop:565 length:513 start_codon:yes stop_codon:yes gene_type:complete